MRALGWFGHSAMFQTFFAIVAALSAFSLWQEWRTKRALKRYLAGPRPAPRELTRDEKLGRAILLYWLICIGVAAAAIASMFFA